MKKVTKIIMSLTLLLFTGLLFSVNLTNYKKSEEIKSNIFNTFIKFNSIDNKSYLEKDEDLNSLLWKNNFIKVNNDEISTFNNFNHSKLEDKIAPFIQKYYKKEPLNDEKDSVVYVYDKVNIENTIIDHFSNELNDNYLTNLSRINNFTNDVNFVVNYLKIEPLHRDNEFKNKLADFYIDKMNQSNNAELNYVQNDMWNLYQDEVKEVTSPEYFNQTINGHRDLSNPLSKFYKFLMLFVVMMIITTTIATLIVSNGSVATLVPLVAKALTKVGITFKNEILAWLVPRIVKRIIVFPIKAIADREIVNPIFEKIQIEEVLLKNKEFLTKEYGEDIYNKYEVFFKQGFKNGFGNKFLGAFGRENVKDRAVLIFDQIKNPLWDLNYIKTHSLAKYRKWVAWKTYELEANRDYYPNINKKLVFFTSTLATKGSWTGTYYGDIDNQKENYYDVHWGRNFLEYTKLTLIPNFSKKSQNLSKSQFVNHQLNVTRNYANLYQNDPENFNTEMSLDYKTKKVFENYPIKNKKSEKFSIFGRVFK